MLVLNQYVLRFLKGVSEKDIQLQDMKKKNLNKNINKGLKNLCQRIGIEPVTLYSARHTYATDSINGKCLLLLLVKTFYIQINLLLKDISIVYLIQIR